MAKGYNSSKKAISAGNGEYLPPVKKVDKTPEQKAKHAQQIKDAKKKHTERFKQMKEDNPELLQKKSKDAKRKANKRAEIKASMSSENPLSMSEAHQAIFNRGYEHAMNDITAREDTVNSREAA